MNRDEHRKACIEAMTTAYWRKATEGFQKRHACITAAFDALHGIATVTTPQNGIPDLQWADLTNPPEGKP